VDQMATADGAGKSRFESARRLARMIGKDALPDGIDTWDRLARHIADTQLAALRAACERALARGILDKNAPLVGAGVGSFVVEQIARSLDRPYVDFTGLFGCALGDPAWVSACAPAVAVAVLAKEAA
ncbi:MAG: hydantoinase/oxoprolinase family protein, partial [Burkholderiales bacterium]